jgi:hypothetical protein
MGALHRLTRARFELFTTAPAWFFEESVGGTFRYHEAVVDIGFHQKSALEADLGATVDALRSFVPFDESLVERLAARVRETGCQAVLCDISPLGVAVADAAGLPSVLVENFTWGWLYEPLVAQAAGLEAAGLELDRWLNSATVHLQARPVCQRRADLELVDPISRERRTTRSDTRARLRIGQDEPLVVVTMGGYGEELPFLDRLRSRGDERFLITGAPTTRRDGNLILFDNNTPLFMPDVLHAADAVVAKLGYGTVSEVWREGIPLAGVTRPNFREMPALEEFARSELQGFSMDAGDFANGTWIERLDELQAMTRTPRPRGGAERVAELVTSLLS